jgi:hypothetical protein
MKLKDAQATSDDDVEKLIATLIQQVNGGHGPTVAFALAAVCVDLCLSNGVPLADFIEVMQEMHDTHMENHR